jgi:hypothetical protein
MPIVSPGNALSVVPFYLYGEEPLVGFRPYEDILKLVDAE